MKWFSQWLDDLTPRQLTALHKWGLAVWVTLGIPATALLGTNIKWTAAMSLYANIMLHATGYPSARAELKMDDSNPATSTN